MPPFSILWPTFALVALIFVIWFWLFVARTAHMKRNPPTADSLATGESSLRYFEPVGMPANNLRNLFEMPVLFFALVPLLLITRHADHLQVLLAWIFVILRVLHSLIHIGSKRVPLRFFVYLASCAVLLAMWVGFFIDLSTAAHRYDTVMANLTL